MNMDALCDSVTVAHLLLVAVPLLLRLGVAHAELEREVEGEPVEQAVRLGLPEGHLLAVEERDLDGEPEKDPEGVPVGEIEEEAEARAEFEGVPVMVAQGVGAVVVLAR